MTLSNLAHRFDDEFIIPTMQLNVSHEYSSGAVRKYFNAPTIDLSIYHHVIIGLSGGKDSIACLLALIEQGVDLRKVELWHHDVDGQEGSTLMDWPFMREYNKALAKHFNLPIYFSWLEGGFEGEMLKEDSFSKPHIIETPDGLFSLPRTTKITKRIRPRTRLKFPQQSPSLSTRWCSSALKIDVGRRQLSNQVRFHNKNVLFITGERREESPKRSTYNQLEFHAVDGRNGRLGRRVDSWRPVLNWSEEQVWEIIERHSLHAPLPYQLGWSRSSCMKCIFNSDIIWSTLFHYFPELIIPIEAYEKQFANTISRDQLTVIERAKSAKPLSITNPQWLRQAISENYELPIALAANETWKLPAGAFSKEKSGAI